ncbi:hypothetical protein [Cupriavidus necator]
MGNSHLASKCHIREVSLNETLVLGANGILARIPGQYVSAALSRLPPAASTLERHQEIEMDAGPAGRVRFFAEKMREPAIIDTPTTSGRCTVRSQ